MNSYDSYGGKSITFWLGLRPVPYEGAQVWYCKLGEQFYEWELIGPSIESNILLFCWRDMLTNYLCIYVHSLALSSNLVRTTSFCSGQSLRHRFITHQSNQNKWLLSAQSWMECLYQQLPRSPRSGTLWEKRQKEYEIWNIGKRDVKSRLLNMAYTLHSNS